MRRLSAALAAFFVVSLAWGQGYPKTNATKLWNVSIAQPVAGDDGQYLRFNYAANTLTWEAVVSGPTWDSTLDAATGNETAFNVAYTVNKATSGNDTGLLISMTDTASPGTSKPLSIQTGAAGTTEVAYIDNAGAASFYGAKLYSGVYSGDYYWAAIGGSFGGLYGSNQFYIGNAGLTTAAISGTASSGFRMKNDLAVLWSSSSTDSTASFDTGLARASAGRVKFTDGSTGYGAPVLGANQVQLAGVKTGLSDNTATGFADIAIAANEYVSGSVIVTGTATDATDTQTSTQRCEYSAVRKVDTVTTAIQCGTAASAVSGGTVDTFAVTAVADTGKLTLKVQMDSSLSVSAMTVRYTIIANSTNAITRL